MSAEDQVSNGSRQLKAGTKVPWCLGNVHALIAYLWKSTSAHGGQPYESIAVDPCPGMVLFLVLVFSGEDHLRVFFSLASAIGFRWHDCPCQDSGLQPARGANRV